MGNNQSTRETLRGLDRAEYLGLTTETLIPSVSPRLSELFSVLASGGEGEEPRVPDWDVVQRANVGLLGHAVQAAREASHAYRLSKARIAQLVLQRRTVAESLRQHHRNLRRAFEGAYPRPLMDLAGLGAPPERPFLGVREQCRDVVTRMNDPELPEKLGQPAVGQTHLDFRQLAQELEDTLTVFESTLDELTEARKLRDEALIAKRASQKHLRRMSVNVARVQEGYYRMAGLDDLASRIRNNLPVRSSRTSTDSADSPDAPPHGEPGDRPDTPPTDETDEAPDAEPPSPDPQA